MDDLISRQAAIDALWKALYEYEDKTEKQFQESENLDVGDWIVHRNFVQNMNDIDRQTILDLPSAQPERKTGRWIYGEDNPGTGRDGWFCSECEHFEMWDYSADMKSAELNLPNFCPNCGARMI